MATNILAIPLVQMGVSTSNNEDWLESMLYLVDADPEPIDQLDLRGIVFLMEVRREADDHEVILQASTDDGTLAIGAPPDYGFLRINVPVTEMRTQKAGNYVADITATADNFIRVVVQMNLTIVEGVTKP